MLVSDDLEQYCCVHANLRTEVMPLHRLEAIATKYVVQYTCSALASGFAVPIIDAVGVGIQCTISAILVGIAGGLCVLVALYGIDMQRWVDCRWPRTIASAQINQSDYDGPALEHVRSAP